MTQMKEHLQSLGLWEEDVKPGSEYISQTYKDNVQEKNKTRERQVADKLVKQHEQTKS